MKDFFIEAVFAQEQLKAKEAKEVRETSKSSDSTKNSSRLVLSQTYKDHFNKREPNLESWMFGCQVWERKDKNRRPITSREDSLIL